MTLGEYPASVPAQWLFDPKLFASEHDIGHFPDIAGSVGLDLDGLAGGVVLEDFDNDGFLDLMLSSWGVNNQLRLFRNNGDGTFTEVSKAAGFVPVCMPSPSHAGHQPKGLLKEKLCGESGSKLLPHLPHRGD